MHLDHILVGMLLLGGFLFPEGALAQSAAPPIGQPGQAQDPTVNPLTYDDYMSLGYNAEQEGRYYEAAQYFRSALYLNPGDRAATVAYWNVRNAISNDTNAAGNFDQQMNMGYDATDAGNYEVALEHFEAALEIRPGNPYATQAILNVQTYLDYGEDELSDPILYDIVNPADPTLGPYVGESPYDRYMRLGYAALQQEEFVTAANYFRGALYERPSDRKATIAYWNAVDGSQDGEAGLGSETETESPYDRYMRLGYDATQRGNYADALNFFEQALELRPGDYYATEAIENVATYMNE